MLILGWAISPQFQFRDTWMWDVRAYGVKLVVVTAAMERASMCEAKLVVHVGEREERILCGRRRARDGRLDVDCRLPGGSKRFWTQMVEILKGQCRVEVKLELGVRVRPFSIQSRRKERTAARSE